MLFIVCTTRLNTNQDDGREMVKQEDDCMIVKAQSSCEGPVVATLTVEVSLGWVV